jgi:Beta/Gamma crystallin
MPFITRQPHPKVVFSTSHTFNQNLSSPNTKLTIADADIIFYGEDALAGAKEYATLEVGQGFSWMTCGMSQASVAFVRRGVWALYDAENFRGRMMVVSEADEQNLVQLSPNGIHILEAAVRSYKRVR